MNTPIPCWAAPINCSQKRAEWSPGPTRGSRVGREAYVIWNSNMAGFVISVPWPSPSKTWPSFSFVSDKLMMTTMMIYTYIQSYPLLLHSTPFLPLFSQTRGQSPTHTHHNQQKRKRKAISRVSDSLQVVMFENLFFHFSYFLVNILSPLDAENWITGFDVGIRIVFRCVKFICLISFCDLICTTLSSLI